MRPEERREIIRHDLVAAWREVNVLLEENVRAWQ
jgi:hypothetical protein